MNKGAKGISYTHLVKNNVVPLVIGAFVIARKISIKEVTTHPLWSMPHQLSQGGAATEDPMHASHCHQSKGSNPDESKADTWMSQGLKGPWAGKLPQTRVNTGNRP
jgi:hypothetical protein